MADKRVSEMETGQIGTDSLVPFSVPDSNNQSGYGSRKDSASAIADRVLNTFEFPTRLNTEDKTLFGAINELAQGGGGGSSSYTDVTGTLTAGSTSITLSDNTITSNSTIDFYTDTFGVNPTAVSLSTGSITLTFEAQASNVSVKVRVWGTPTAAEGSYF